MALKGMSKRNALKTYCKHGHDIRLLLDDGTPNPNVFRHKRGGRQCLECNRTRARAAMRAKRDRQYNER